MQKSILINLLLVSLLGIVLTTAALYVIQTNMAYRAADETFVVRLKDVEERIRENELKITELTEAIKEDFISRARALAMMIELEPQIIYDRKKLDEVVVSLNVDEVHIIDENGILCWGTQPEYYGMDFASTDQTRPFLAILDDPALEIVQDPMPNGFKSLIRQYAGVSLHNQKGIAQIGMKPERLEKALENNTIDKILKNIPVRNNGYFFVIDAVTNLIIVHPDNQLVGTLMKDFPGSGLMKIDGQEILFNSRQIGEQIVVVAIPSSEVFADRTFYTVVFMIFMISVFSVICLAVNTYMSKNIVRGISDTVLTLERISDGDLSVTANVHSNEEFTKLSNGINHMLSSINGKISEIAVLSGDKERLADIVAIADAGIIIKDKNGIVLEWNIGAENIIGYKPYEIIGKTTHSYAPENVWKDIDEVEMRLKKGEHIAHIDVVRKHKEGHLIDCSSSYTPIFNNGEFNGSVTIFHDITDKKTISQVLREAYKKNDANTLVGTQLQLSMLQGAYDKIDIQNQMILSSIDYASKIQKNFLPRNHVFEDTFTDYSVIWKPRDMVSGDIYWIKAFDEGTILCVCDCTGHGIPGALLTMLVISAFEAAVNESNYKDTAEIIWLLEQRFVNVFRVNDKEGNEGKKSELQEGCDLAVLFIAKDGTVTISSGHIHVFVCDGKEVNQIKGQNIYIGEGKLRGKQDVKIVRIPADAVNKFYIGSDGLFDQMGGTPVRPFGYKRFKEIILDNHNERQSVISDKVWEAYESYRGEQSRRDDFELISFKP